MIRVCLSDSPDCTGIAPCEPCSLAIRTRVLPAAMVAAGFNGNPQVAHSFFFEYMRSHERLLDEVREAFPPAPEPPKAEESVPMPGEHIGEHLGFPVGAPVYPTIEESRIPDGYTEAGPLTADEIAEMGTAEDFAEDETEPGPEPGPATLSPKAARAFARKARRLKQKRAGKAVPVEKEEPHHGKED